MKNFYQSTPTLLALSLTALMSVPVYAVSSGNALTDGTNVAYRDSRVVFDEIQHSFLTDNSQPSTAPTASQSGSLADVASSPAWRKLLLLDKKGKPTAKDPHFLLAGGDTRAELDAIIKAIDERDDKVLCAFPARTHYVAEQLGLALDDSGCDEFHAWAKQYDARALSLTFADEHPNSLGSAFAHVMIKADTEQSLASGRDDDAFAINYTVARDKADGEAEASARSLVGGYAGIMEFYDYDEKRDVYLLDDERDIWEYRLNLTTAEVAQIMRHVWEIKDLKRSYFFTHDNCASEILRLIDVVRGSELREAVGKVVIPNEVARVLTDKGLVRDTKYLPSKISTAQAVQNGTQGVVTSPSNPAHASPTHRIGLSVGYDDSYHGTRTGDNDGTTFGLSLRSAYHDVLDRPVGVRQYLDVEMLSLDVRYDDRLKVDKATVFSTRSYNPTNTAKAHNGMAWGQHARLMQVMDGSDRDNDDHMVFDVRLEKGKSWTLGQGELGTGRLADTLCYVFGGYGGQVGHINKGYRVGAGVNVGCIHHASDKVRVMGELALPVWYHHNQGETRSTYVQPALNVGVQYDISPTYALRLTGKAERGRDDTHEQVALAVLRYF
ncbi:DUF4105 domain-containing protein [Moraxella bovis]|uniref:Lnb N-terminal periplasmic domain-containing protein n=1 Tax=Moraxella bovis TaxID=476 RepID=UPI002227CC45|nr:DUF4105 domain-containing protein [Moraxella bovis]UYZ75373.1 DUF4105 domain-containing protein [Moraxella bovis]UYZ92605.1 DUF4105 domain-containing protein [Moraxella bovis]